MDNRASGFTIAGILLLSMACVLFAGCSSEPKTLKEMLLYVDKNYAKEPEKTLAEYKKFGTEGEQALLTCFFDIDPSGPPDHFSKDQDFWRRFGTGSARALLEKLSEDRAFLQRIIDFSNARRKSVPFGMPKEIAWVKARDEAMFSSWFAALPPEDVRFVATWKGWRQENPAAAYAAAYTVLADNIDRVKARTDKWVGPFVFALREGKPSFQPTPEQYHFIFANGLERYPFGYWNLTPDNWIRACPEDLGLCIWPAGQPQVEPPDGKGGGKLEGTGLFLLSNRISGETVQPTPQGNKIMIVYDSSFAGYYRQDFKKTAVFIGMMRYLPKNLTPEHLWRYDKKITIKLETVKVFSYNNGTAAVQCNFIVTFRDVRSGKVISEKKIEGARPPSTVSIRSGSKPEYIEGVAPWEETVRHIAELAKQ